MYDAYLPLVRRAGGVPKFVTLKPPHWTTFDEADPARRLLAAYSRRSVQQSAQPRRRRLWPGKLLQILARACVKHDVIALCDEVWEHVVFDGLSHVPLMAMEGMRERTVKIGSAGKIFSLTGWKVGFVCAAPAILRVLAKAHQFITFTTPPNLQAAVAYGLAKDDAYFTGMRAGYERSRDRFAAGLTERGFAVLPSAGTYFLNIDLAPLGCEDDVAFCRELVERYGVAAIPVSAFYAEAPIRTVARFCFAKRDETLDAALDRLSGVVAGERV